MLVHITLKAANIIGIQVMFGLRLCLEKVSKDNYVCLGDY